MTRTTGGIRALGVMDSATPRRRRPSMPTCSGSTSGTAMYQRRRRPLERSRQVIARHVRRYLVRTDRGGRGVHSTSVMPDLDNKVRADFATQGWTEIKSYSRNIGPHLSPSTRPGPEARAHDHTGELAARDRRSRTQEIRPRSDSLRRLSRDKPGPSSLQRQRPLVRISALPFRERIPGHSRSLRGGARSPGGGVALLQTQHHLGGQAGRRLSGWTSSWGRNTDVVGREQDGARAWWGERDSNPLSRNT